METELPVAAGAAFPPAILFKAEADEDAATFLNCEMSFVAEVELVVATVFPSETTRRDVETIVDAAVAPTDENFSFDADGEAVAANDLPWDTLLFEAAVELSEATFPAKTTRAFAGVADDEAVRK